VQEPEKVQEARAQQRSKVKLNEQKEESRSLLSGGGGNGQSQEDRQPQEKVMPLKSERVANRNDKVSVQYPDGRVLRDVKYKKVEEDIKSNKCIVIE
jgi:preprotein translocase subunit SecA